MTGNVPWSESKDEKSPKSTLCEWETSCVAEKIQVPGWKRVSVYLVTLELESSSYRGIHVTESAPQSSAVLFMAFVGECDDFAPYNHRLIDQSFLVSAPCLSFLAELLAAALVSCFTWFRAPWHTC